MLKWDFYTFTFFTDGAFNFKNILSQRVRTTIKNFQILRSFELNTF